MKSTLLPDLKYSINDGIFAHVFATLTGGLFLTGLALHLGMNEVMIGLLSAAPFVATLFQFPTSFVLELGYRRKRMTIGAAVIARGLWLPIVMLILLPGVAGNTAPEIILGLVFLSHVFISISYVSWLSWISDIVPAHVRGRFFGTRNMLCSAAGMITMLVFAHLLDFFKLKGQMTAGFIFILISAVLFGARSLYFQKRISEPVPPPRGDAHMSFFSGFFLPFGQKNFRRFVLFSFAWSFAVYFASPFFTLYFLRELRFSYAFVGVLGTLSALADLLGMHIWGRISDKVKNKAVIRFAAWFVVFLPLAWVTVQPGSRLMPILLHIIGGGFWAGISLCMNNLLFGIAPKEHKPFYLSVYSIAAGLGAALSPLAAGWFMKSMDAGAVRLPLEIAPIQLVFMISTVLRFLAFRMFNAIHEPDEASPIQVIRIIRNIRALNVASGFNQLLHPFIEISREAELNGDA